MTKRRNSEAGRKRADLGKIDEGSVSPFAVLAKPEFVRHLPTGGTETSRAHATDVASSAGHWSHEQLLFRFQRKGFGGKSATIVEGVGDVGKGNELLKELAKALGTRGRQVTRASLDPKSDVPEQIVWVLGGDQRDAAKRFFESKGYRNVKTV